MIIISHLKKENFKTRLDFLSWGNGRQSRSQGLFQASEKALGKRLNERGTYRHMQRQMVWFVSSFGLKRSV